MSAKRGHNWQPKGVHVQTCTKCGWQKWTPWCYHSPDGATKDTGRPRPWGKEPPCVPQKGK